MLPRMPPCLSGFATGAQFVEDKTCLLKLKLMRTGNASEFGEVLTRHAAWAGEAHPGVGNWRSGGTPTRRGRRTSAAMILFPWPCTRNFAALGGPS